jgi:hypothetical protein
VTFCRRAKLPDHGVRERLIAGAGCHATPPAHGSPVADTARIDAGKTGSASLRLRTAMMRVGRRDCGAVKLLSTQIVCSTRRKQFVSNEDASCLQGRRQRFPTVRTVAGLGNSEEPAKSANNRACTSTACCKCPWTLGIRMVPLLKSGASRQEKASACNRNGAAADEHFCYKIIFQGCTDVNAARTKHLDSLFNDDGLAAGC